MNSEQVLLIWVTDDDHAVRVKRDAGQRSVRRETMEHPSSLALVNNLLRVLITNMDNMGDSWSPCRNPLRCHICGPGSPLSITLVLLKNSKMATHSWKRGPKLILHSTSKSNAQDTESNA